MLARLDVTALLAFRQWRWLAAATSLLAFAGTAQAESVTKASRIPDEYESTSGHGLALNNAGYAATDGVTAVRANPALLPASKQYVVSGGYHWPTEGREYYQAGVVDASTSQIAAGVTYTGFLDDYEYARVDGDASPVDSPIVRRGVLGVGQSFGSFSLGAGATYVEAFPLWSDVARDGDEGRIKGAGLNVGIASNLTSELAIGASVENTSNRRIAAYAPRTYRGGVAYAFGKSLIGYLDYRQRDRVAEFEPSAVVDLDTPTSDAKLDPEQMALASFSAQLQEFLRILGSYGHALSDERRSLAAGVAVVNRSFSISYTVAKPYMKYGVTHQAVALSLDVAM